MESIRDRPRAMLGLTDTAFLVMGGIVGSGIFMNPHVVAMAAPSATAILGAWILGGLVALAGGFIWAELAARCPGVGGQYVYLKEGFHPAWGFVYGWSNLLVTQTGGMAAVAVTFARYAHTLARPRWSEAATAVAALVVLTVVNLFGVKVGGRVQSVFMALKLVAILALIVVGLALAPAAAAAPAGETAQAAPGLGAFLAAMIAVLFAYGGWATATFVSGEIEDSTRTLPRALLFGTIAVVLLYVGVNLACVRALGVSGLVASDTPASEVMRAALGAPGATFIAWAIAVSTFGFLAQGMLTYPRVYYAMSRDGLFFKSIGRLHPKTGVPHVAIVVQCVLAVATALSGSYEQILSWVVTVDFVFLALTAATLFVFRRRGGGARVAPRTPGGVVTAAFFIVVSLAVVAATFWVEPVRSLIGWAIVASGIPVYLFWRRRAA
jgi:APA family basic amino acid/polyamine antiporter